MLDLLVGVASALVVSVQAPNRCLPLQEIPVQVTWEARADLPLVVSGDPDRLPSPAWFEIEGPRGKVWHRDATMVEMETADRWQRGKVLSQLVVLSYGWVNSSPSPGPLGYAFPEAGGYRLRVHYIDARAELDVASSWAQIAVEAPTDPEDVAVLAALRAGIGLGQLREEHSGSAYFSRARLRSLKSRAHQVDEGVDPASGERVRLSDGELNEWKLARYEELSRAFEVEAERSGLLGREALTAALRLTSEPGRRALLESKLDSNWAGWRNSPE